MKTFKTMNQLVEHIYSTRYDYCNESVHGFDHAFLHEVANAVVNGQWDGLSLSKKTYSCYNDYRQMAKKRIYEWRKANRLKKDEPKSMVSKHILDDFPSNTFSLYKEVKRPSKDIHASIRRFERARTPKLESSLNLCANVDYYLKHGKLPSNTDMAKVMGKGMYKGRGNYGR